MIDQITNKLSLHLKTKYPEELPSLAVTRYSVKFIISNLLPLIILLISAWLLNLVPEVITAYLGFSILRMFSGGYHIKSADLCVVASVSLIYLIVGLSNYLSNYYKLLIIIISIILALIYSPSNIKKQTKIKEEYFIYLKIATILIIVSNIFINSNILTIAFFMQSLSLIRKRVNSDKEVIRNEKD